MKKIIFLSFVLLVFLGLFCSCGKKDRDKIFRNPATEIYNNYANISLKDIEEDIKRKKDKFDEIGRQFIGTNKKYTSEYYKAEEDYNISIAYLNERKMEEYQQQQTIRKNAE
ncbi:MAG: hypothetical protein LBR59_00540 [Endomicrobium sp.]|jgi:hypothetical protein|nr:hypothetical protein [Endomicrobium sp.]